MARDVSNWMRSLSAIKGNLSLACTRNSSRLYSVPVPVLTTRLKSGHQSRKPANSLSISSQFPQGFRGGWVNPNGALPTNSRTNSERAGDVMVERPVQRDDIAGSDKLGDWVWSTMDRSDLFSRKSGRLGSSGESGDVNRYIQSWLHRRNRVATSSHQRYVW